MMTAEAPRIGFRLKSSTISDLTPALVGEYRAMEESPIERELNKAHVKHLRERADAGTLVTFHWVRAHILSLNKIVRVNGHHSSTMLDEMDGMMPTGLKVLQEEYECDDGDAFALLFQQFDDRKSARGPADIAGVYQGLQPDLQGLSKPYAKVAIDGYAWHLRQVERAPSPIGDMIYTMFNDNGLHPYIKWVTELNTSKTRELQKPPVAAAMFGTFSANETTAREFWGLVARAGDPDQEDLPESVLSKWLLLGYEHGYDQFPGKFGAANLYQGCVNAWNAAREGKRLTTLRYEIKKNLAQIRA